MNRSPFLGEDRLGGADPGVLRLLEEREARRVGVREADAADGLLERGAVGVPDEAGVRARHGVAPEVDVDVRDERREVGVGPREVGEDGLGQLAPGRGEELLARLPRLLAREDEVVGEDGRAVRPPGLVRRDDVAEAARVVEDVVPAEGKAAVGGASRRASGSRRATARTRRSGGRRAGSRATARGPSRR